MFGTQTDALGKLSKDLSELQSPQTWPHGLVGDIGRNATKGHIAMIMKREIDLEKAAEAESFGSLAVSHRRTHRRPETARSSFTPAQKRALSDLVGSLVQTAKEIGTERKRVTVGSFSFEIKEDGSEEVLSIRKPGAS